MGLRRHRQSHGRGLSRRGQPSGRRHAAAHYPIQQHILPGTTVWSDQWAAYRQLTAVTGLPHATVNHSLNFVDPGTGVNTNAIENLWKCAKDKFEHMHGTSDAHISSYLAEYNHVAAS